MRTVFESNDPRPPQTAFQRDAFTDGRSVTPRGYKSSYVHRIDPAWKEESRTLLVFRQMLSPTGTGIASLQVGNAMRTRTKGGMTDRPVPNRAGQNRTRSTRSVGWAPRTHRAEALEAMFILRPFPKPTTAPGRLGRTPMVRGAHLTTHLSPISLTSHPYERAPGRAQRPGALPPSIKTV